MCKLFKDNNKKDIKFLCAFSSCYHKMKMNDSNLYFNFPMSKSLKQTFETFNRSRHSEDKEVFAISRFGMRLACQQNV